MLSNSHSSQKKNAKRNTLEYHFALMWEYFSSIDNYFNKKLPDFSKNYLTNCHALHFSTSSYNNLQFLFVFKYLLQIFPLFLFLDHCYGLGTLYRVILWIFFFIVFAFSILTQRLCPPQIYKHIPYFLLIFFFLIFNSFKIRPLYLPWVHFCV